MKAIVNEGCIGCGTCEGICPSVFRLNDEGVSEVYGEVTPELESAVRDAEGSCPVGVISVED